MAQRLTAAQRFEQHVDHDGPISTRRGAPGPCHLWTRGLDRDGYGRFWHAGRVVAAHRYAYEQALGPIPAGLELDHRCTVRHCVNPAHLDAVDHRTNVLRSTGPSARNAARRQCRNGHDLTDPANVHTSYPPSHPNGMRKCRACNRGYARRAREKQLAPVVALTPRTTNPSPERQAA